MTDPQIPEPVEGHEDPAPEPGTVVGPVTVGPIAHGGHCVARHEGRVIFTRHALPGEQVMITLTDTSQRSFWRGDATTVIEAAADRVTPVCEIAGPGGCGGCDFQHVDLAAQRRLKTQVLAEQLHRLAGLDLEVEVEEVPVAGDDHDPGLGWRTRMRYQLDGQGRPGLRAHRSHQVIGLPAAGCRISDPSIADPSIAAPSIGRPAGSEPGRGAGSEPGREAGEIIGVAASDGVHWPVDAETITEHAIGRDWLVAGDGFWQVHPAAADLLVRTVLDGLDPQPGESAFDLYCGVGLFAGGLLAAGCRVIGVEGSRTAVQLARRNLAGIDGSASFIADRVDRALARRETGDSGRRASDRRGGDRRGADRRGDGNRRRKQDRRNGPRPLPSRTDLVVLDPPRSGAGRAVIDQIAERGPRAIGYVACDPAALARDLGYLAARGYWLTGLRAFDLFPMTHHLECVAILRRHE